MWQALCNFLISIINLIYRLVPNYGAAIILFTILVKALLTPLDLKSRRGMRKTAALQPKMDALKKKYGGDQQKLNEKMQELYKSEGVSMFGGCLPMLLSMPILFAMFSAMRSVANEQLIAQFLQMIHGQVPTTEPFLWIKNLWMPDTFFAPVMPDVNALRAILEPSVWNAVSERLVAAGTLPQETLLALADKEALQAYLETIPALIQNAPNYADYLQPLAGWNNVSVLLFKFTVFVRMNGFFILPALAVATQYVSQKFMQQPGAQTEATASTNKTMMMMMPIMSLFFCTTSSSAFALYWVTSNIIATAQQVAFNKYFAWEDKKTAIAGEVGK